LMHHRSRIKIEKKIGWTGHIQYFYRIYPVRSDISDPRPDMSVSHFQQQHLMIILSVIS
jgi:hypothetical protein